MTCRRALVLTLLGLLAVAPAAVAGERLAEAPAHFSSRVLARGLGDPFEVAWGPDGWLWVSERSGRRVTRVRPSDGRRRVALALDEVLHTPGTQDGLLGMALHPDLLRGRGADFVYLAFTYDADPGPDVDERVQIRRYTWSRRARRLVAPVVLVAGLPASADHDGGRLAIGPDRHLYYAIGDQGANQFSRACLPIRAQELPTAAEVAAGDWFHYQGKILRLALDGSIPADNPVLDGVRSHVWTYGHRNPQGLAFGPGGRLWSVEHGPKSDDELNLLVAGGNYGWPHVAGFRDDRAYTYANWSAAPDCEDLEFTFFDPPPAVPQARESDWSAPDFVAPVRTFYTVDDGWNFQDPRCAEGGRWFVCWPSIAPSSVEVYAPPRRSGVRDWGRSLLVTTLKLGTVFRLPLGDDGTSVGEPEPLFATVNRYRDVAVDPTGRRFFVATDNGGLARGPDGRPAAALANPGAILEFRAGR